MVAPPGARLQARGTGNGTRVGTRVVNAALAARFLTLAVASLVLGMARASARVLTIQCALARMLGVVYARNYTRS
jgi:hypothetical protein